MVEIPAWLATVAGSVFLILLAVVGYLVKLVVSVMHGRLGLQDAKIDGFDGKLDDIKESLGHMDRRFVEVELSVTRQFVDKESHTRDYITLTGRVDAVHKRVDRIERERGSGSTMGRSD